MRCRERSAPTQVRWTDAIDGSKLTVCSSDQLTHTDLILRGGPQLPHTHQTQESSRHTWYTAGSDRLLLL